MKNKQTMSNQAMQMLSTAYIVPLASSVFTEEMYSGLLCNYSKIIPRLILLLDHTPVK